MAKVDVVVPCYNYGRFLEGCVESVLRQSVHDLRVLIIDDASSDDSLSVATKLAQRDPRVTVIAHPHNKGHIDTYNEGIQWASSDYFLLLSADDLLVAGSLERATEVMDANPDIALTHGDCIAWFDDLALPVVEPRVDFSWTRQDLIGEMCATGANLVPTPTAIVRTRVQKLVGGYRKSLPHTGDMEMWLRLAANGAVARINAVQAIYRKHSTAMSNAYYAEISSDFEQCHQAFESFFREFGHRLPNERSLRVGSRRSLAQRAFQRGIGLWRRGQFNKGLRLVQQAMKLDPKLRYLPPVWRILKIPGAEGREWAKSVMKEAAGKLYDRAAHLSKTERPQ